MSEGITGKLTHTAFYTHVDGVLGTALYTRSVELAQAAKHGVQVREGKTPLPPLDDAVRGFRNRELADLCDGPWDLCQELETFIDPRGVHFLEIIAPLASGGSGTSGARARLHLYSHHSHEVAAGGKAAGP